jgi:hypothetical protein
VNVAVVIPWVDRGCPHRAQAYRFVREYWRAWAVRYTTPSVFATVSVAAWNAEPFSRAAAINRGVLGMTAWDADVILQSDPDSIVSPQAALEAVLQALEPGLVVAFDRYRYLTADSTEKVLRGGPVADSWPEGSFDYLPADDEGAGGVGNVVAFSRHTWETAGGYDERFGTWGADDGAFALAAGTLTGPLRRVPGDCLHLWHPRLAQSVPGHPEYDRSMALVHQYHAAAESGPDAMRALIASR